MADRSLRLQIWKTLTGGFVGGIFGGALLAVSYLPHAPHGRGALYVAMIVAAGAFAGSAMSLSCHAGAALCGRLRAVHRVSAVLLNELIGSAAFGSIAGACLGAIFAVVFGSQQADWVSYNPLLISLVLAALSISVATVAYTTGRTWPQVIFSGFLANSLILLVPTLAAQFFRPFFINQYLSFSDAALEDYGELARTGGTLGIIGGAIIGAQIGLTLLLLRRSTGRSIDVRL